MVVANNEVSQKSLNQRKEVGMQALEDVKQKVLSHVNEDRLISLLSKLIQIPSPVEEDAAEKEISEYLQGYWREMGLEVFVQDVPQLEGTPKGPHPQIIGRFKGKGGGIRFMMGGHIDTEPVVQPELWTKDPFGGYVDRKEMGPEGKGYIYGLGTANMKQSVASFTEAVHAVMESGIDLKGDLLVTGWVMEDIGCIGSKYQIEHWDEIGVGPFPDMVLDGEPSNCEVRSAHVGSTRFTITTKGQLAHVSQRYTRRPEYEGKKHINAFEKMFKILVELKDVPGSFTYTRHPYIGDCILTIGDIRTKTGGKGGRPILGSSECQVDFDLRFVPGMTHASIQNDVERVLYRLMVEDPELEASMRLWPAKTSPTELANDHPLHQALRKAHKEIFGKELVIDTDGKGTSFVRMIDRCKYGGTDIGNFYAAGIPGTNYGAAGVPVTPDERVSIPQLVKHCKVSTLVALEMCGVQ
jgi:acetylornithine deacetylase